jgi:hypothetical protein
MPPIVGSWVGCEAIEIVEAAPRPGLTRVLTLAQL